MRNLSILAWATLTLLAACGGTNLGTEGSGSGSSTGTTGTSTGTGTTSSTTYELGNGTGSSFSSGVIGLSSKSLSAGGTTSVTLDIVNSSGTLYTADPVTVTFSSSCLGSGLATIVPSGASTAGATAGTITSSTGVINATYTAAGCSGSDALSASATVGSQTLTASGTLTVAAAAIGSIAFISASPEQMSLKGVGSANTSTLVFKVLDTSGGPRAGATVNFALSTSLGGITLAPASATTDASGEAQTVVSAGTVATSVTVTASTTASSGNVVSTDSNSLAVSTGIPTSGNITLAVKCNNVEAWNKDGVTVPLTVTMRDRFSNPVADGTTATLRTTLGLVTPNCSTTSGTCTATWTSGATYTVNGNPQSTASTAYTNSAYCGAGFPSQQGLCNGTTNGRSPLYVTAIGEESFKDATGNGYFNPGDTVAWDATDADNDYTSGANVGKPKPWMDTFEPFLNEWELFDSYGTPIYQLGEPFYDFFGKGVWQGPDGLVESALCEGPLCNTASASVGIFASNVIILSGTHANFSPVSGSTININSSGSSVIAITVMDDRNQQMANGTTVAATLSSSVGTLVNSSYTWPCSSAVGGSTFDFVVLPPATGAPAAGTMSVTVTSQPSGIISTAVYTINP